MSKSPYLDISIDVSIHIRTKDVVTRGFKSFSCLYTPESDLSGVRLGG